MIPSTVSLKASKVFHQKVKSAPNLYTYEWQEDNVHSFNEIMISWNALRPSRGKYAISISVKTESWSPWLPYAHWGSDGQKSFDEISSDSSLHVFQDILEIKNKKGTGFKVRIEALEGASLHNAHALHVCATDLDALQPDPLSNSSRSVCLEVRGLSQIALNHSRNTSMCSPTSTTAVVRYLNSCMAPEPVAFAQKAYDGGFDIYGNWVMNVAEAYTHLKRPRQCWVARLPGFQSIHHSLCQGIPVVVSVRGPLKGSSMPYNSGHLIVVKGFDSNSKEVICMDPAFPSDDATTVHYALDNFIEAWGRRNFVAYIFSDSNQEFI